MPSSSWSIRWRPSKEAAIFVFKYVVKLIRHKWFVFVESIWLGVPLLGLIHDASKFLPDEFFPYARSFSGGPYPDNAQIHDIYRQMPSYTGKTKDEIHAEFDVAWNHHQKRNKHHWQYWLLVNDEDGTYPLPMPDRYRREMLADWRGAGRAYGNPNTAEWYMKNRDKIIMHHDTRQWIERRLFREFALPQ